MLCNTFAVFSRTAQYSTAQHSAAQRSTAQHSAAQHSTSLDFRTSSYCSRELKRNWKVVYSHFPDHAQNNVRVLAGEPTQSLNMAD